MFFRRFEAEREQSSKCKDRNETHPGKVPRVPANMSTIITARPRTCRQTEQKSESFVPHPRHSHTEFAARRSERPFWGNCVEHWPSNRITVKGRSRMHRRNVRQAAIRTSWTKAAPISIWQHQAGRGTPPATSSAFQRLRSFREPARPHRQAVALSNPCRAWRTTLCRGSCPSR